jgi:[acyl-carrier-protein] S-malonyltransferase
MGVDLVAIPAAQEKLAQAEEILGWSVLAVCQGDEEKLSRTLYTQPCLFVIEAILVDLLLAQGHTPTLVTGHSLGEYSALYAAQVFDFVKGLELVKIRAELMDSMGQGQMAALMKFDRPLLEQVIEILPDVVLANDNSEQQVVISGTETGVAEAIAKIKPKKAMPLKVSGAFHSPLMAEAAAEFASILERVPFRDAQCPVLSNVNPQPCSQAAELKTRLGQQMTGSVRWREIMLELSQGEIALAVEVGPGNVLSGLLKRACPEISLKNLQKAADLQIF